MDIKFYSCSHTVQPDYKVKVDIINPLSFIVNFKVYYNKPNSSTAYYRYIYTPYTQHHIHCKLTIATAPNTMYRYIGVVGLVGMKFVIWGRT